MESDKVYNKEVYNTFYMGYMNSPCTWESWVEKLDIGLKLIDYTEYGEHNYIITDKKKWILARLKHGF